jgi:LytR cell envelope-related transcriptional attenuator
VDRAEHLSQSQFPWRTATVVATGVATLELVGLIGIGAAHFAHKANAPRATVAQKTQTHAKPVVRRHVVPVPPKDRVAPVRSHPVRARSAIRVLVLNANGVQGAAHAEAARLQSLGYPIAGTANAPSHHYAQSMVMYVPGYLKEARRLAHDVGARLVAPVDGITPSARQGARLVVLLGS